MNLKSDISNLESAMKTTTILTAALAFAMGSLHAQTVPLFINYQGRVTDSAGVGLGTGTPVNRKVIFRIFDAATGGARLWSEQHTVTISNGEFSVLLGNGINANYAGADETPLKTNTPLDTVFTSSGILRYVEIVVDNGDNALNAGDPPIAPRQQITSTAYAFRARSADTVASGTDLQLNGSADYGLGYYGSTRLFNGTAVDGPVLFGQAGGALGSVNGGSKNIALRWNSSGNVGIGSADLSGAAATTKLVLQGDDSNTVPQQLSIRGNSDTNKRLLFGYNTSSNYGSLQAYNGVSSATNLVLNPSGGNIGIGTNFPQEKLTISGVTNYNTGLRLVGSGAEVGMAIENTNTGGRKFDFIAGSSAGGGGGPGLSIYDETANAFRLHIDPIGYVGIGTTTPSQKLDVSGGYANLNGLRISGLDAANTIYQATGDIGINTAQSTQSVKLGSNVGGTVLTIKNGNVGIGVATPSVKLDVAGDLKVSGGVTTGSGASQMVGHAPVVMESKTPADQTSWGINYLNVTGWEDRPGGFKVRIYAQKETAAGDYEVRNYEATIVVEQSGYANNAEFPGIKRISVAWAGSQARASLKLRSSGTVQEIATSDGWLKIMNTQPNPATGSAQYYFGNNNTAALVFLPDVSGKIVISDY